MENTKKMLDLSNLSQFEELQDGNRKKEGSLFSEGSIIKFNLQDFGYPAGVYRQGSIKYKKRFRFPLKYYSYERICGTIFSWGNTVYTNWLVLQKGETVTVEYCLDLLEPTDTPENWWGVDFQVYDVNSPTSLRTYEYYLFRNDIACYVDTSGNFIYYPIASNIEDGVFKFITASGIASEMILKAYKYYRVFLSYGVDGCIHFIRQVRQDEDYDWFTLNHYVTSRRYGDYILTKMFTEGDITFGNMVGTSTSEVGELDGNYETNIKAIVRRPIDIDVGTRVTGGPNGSSGGSITQDMAVPLSTFGFRDMTRKSFEIDTMFKKFGDLTIEELDWILHYCDPSKLFKVGDEIQGYINDPENTSTKVNCSFVILGFNHDAVSGMSPLPYAKITLGMKYPETTDILTFTKSVPGAFDYSTSELKTFVESLYTSWDSPMKRLVKTSFKSSAVAGQTSPVIVPAKFWIPGYKEITGEAPTVDTGGLKVSDGVQYEYFNTGNDDFDIERRKNSTGYWLRSASATPYQYIVNSDGNIETQGTGSYMVFICFCI